MEFDYTATTKKTFNETIQSVQEEIAKSGMRVLYVHDVQKTLGEKGFEREPFNLRLLNSAMQSLPMNF